jgi:transcriptional regulator with XRE-family HTH domain
MTMEFFSGSCEQGLTIGSRIRQIRKSLKMTQKTFAGSLGIVQGFLSAIEKDKKTPSDTLLIALQHLYHVNPEWINAGQGEIALPSRPQTMPHGDQHAVTPLLKDLPADKEDLLQPPLPGRFISLPGIPTNCFAFEYSGDYMLPTIRDGDIIVINPDEPLTSGNIALIVGKWGEPFLRRYREINGDRYFTSDNTSYSPFKQDASIKILGTVIKIWREIKI